MRNLKKVLSLALATVMLLGMMVMGAGAVTTTKDYADGSTVTYKEAVDVMSAIGVFDGTSGSFNPTGNVTRAQAAKIITYMLLGREVAEKLGTLNAPYTDVPASHWAAGSIAYCTNLGIVGGYGNGYFKPDGQVTGYEFAKMLLTALGYDAEREKMTGKDWSTAVARLAITNALDLGVDSAGSSIVLSNALTREEACQMAFNTIKAPMVQYSNTVGSITTPDGTTVNLGGANASLIYDNVHGYAGNIDVENGNGYNTNVLQFGERYFQNLVKHTGQDDDFDRPSRTWTIGREDIGTYSSNYALCYTAKVSADDMKSNLSGYKFGTTNNGGVIPSTNGKPNGAAVTSAAELAALTGNGVVVEIYADNDRIIDDIVIINTYMMTIRRINSENVTFSKIVSGNPTIDPVDKDSKLYSTLTGMKAGDYVLITPVTTNGTDYSVSAVAVPTTQSGSLTRIDKNTSNKTTKVTVGGTAYSVAANQVNNSGDPLVDMDSLSSGNLNILTSKSSIVYLDTYGYAVAIQDVGTTTNYMYVTRAYQSLVNGAIVNMVQGVAPDGTVVTVNCGTNASGNPNASVVSSVGTTTLVSYASATGAQANAYSCDYVLTPLGTTAPTTTTGGWNNAPTSAITNGATALNGTPYSASVKFIYINPNDNSVSVRDGVRAVSTIPTGSAALAVKSASGSSLVTAVFIKGTPTDIDPSKVVYLSQFKAWMDAQTGYAVYEAYIQGEKSEIVVKQNTTGAAASTLAGNFYYFSKEDNSDLYTVGSAITVTNQSVSAIVGAVTGTVDDRLISVSNGTDNVTNVNAANAEVIDLSDNKISSVGDIHDKMAAGYTVTVAVMYNGDVNSVENNTVSYIFVQSVKSGDTTVTTNGCSTTAASLAVNGAATITLKDGQTLSVAAASNDTSKVTVSYNETTKVITITGVAATDAGSPVDVTFTVQAADNSVQAYTIAVTVTAAASAE